LRGIRPSNPPGPRLSRRKPRLRPVPKARPRGG